MKCSRILKGKSGSTIIYVLAVMLLLLAVGASVLTAAFANMGFNRRQRDHAYAVILADSVQKNMMYALGQGSGEEEPLSVQLVKALYQAHDVENGGTGGLADIAIDPVVVPLTKDSNLKVERITLHFPEQQVYIWEADEMMGLNKTAEVSASLVITTVISNRGEDFISTSMHYYYSKGMLENVADSGSGEQMELVVGETGEWEVVKHEKNDL
ncbi:MAG: hypothetical protein FWE25_10695 [Lachnospiraceae bacterium]|nr:hypothetical protein [Lachnospiraceae bacterium]